MNELHNLCEKFSQLCIELSQLCRKLGRLCINLSHLLNELDNLYCKLGHLGKDFDDFCKGICHLCNDFCGLRNDFEVPDNSFAVERQNTRRFYLKIIRNITNLFQINYHFYCFRVDFIFIFIELSRPFLHPKRCVGIYYLIGKGLKRKIIYLSRFISRLVSHVSGFYSVI